MLGEAYTPEDEEDSAVAEITAVWAYQARYRIPLTKAIAGAFCTELRLHSSTDRKCPDTKVHTLNSGGHRAAGPFPCTPVHSMLVVTGYT